MPNRSPTEKRDDDLNRLTKEKATRRWLFLSCPEAHPATTGERCAPACLVAGSAGCGLSSVGSGAGGSTSSGAGGSTSGVGSGTHGGASSRGGGSSSVGSSAHGGTGSGRSGIGSAGSSVSGAGGGISSGSSRRFSRSGGDRLFFFAASGEGSSGDQCGQNERFVHLKSPLKNRNSYPEGFRTLDYVKQGAPTEHKARTRLRAHSHLTGDYSDGRCNCCKP